MISIDFHAHFIFFFVFCFRSSENQLRTPPPHISSSEELLARLTRRTLAQLRKI